MTSESKVALERTFRENGAGKDLHCFSQSRHLSFEIGFKVISRLKWAVSSTNRIEWTPYNVKTIENKKWIKWPEGEVFSSYFVILPLTLWPFCQSGSHISIFLAGDRDNASDTPLCSIQYLSQEVVNVVSNHVRLKGPNSSSWHYTNLIQRWLPGFREKDRNTQEVKMCTLFLRQWGHYSHVCVLQSDKRSQTLICTYTDTSIQTKLTVLSQCKPERGYFQVSCTGCLQDSSPQPYGALN